MQWNELTESKLIDINKEKGCNEKDEDVLEEVTLVKNRQTERTLRDIF